MGRVGTAAAARARRGAMDGAYCAPTRRRRHGGTNFPENRVMIREFFEFRLVLSDFGGSRRKIAQRREGLADQYPDIHGTGNLRWGNREISFGTGNYQAARHAPRDLHV